MSCNPFGTETNVPWIIIFNLSTWMLMWILDGAIGQDFNNTWKASLCLVFFILNALYFVYIVLIHMALVYHAIASLLKRISGRKMKGNKETGLSFWDLVDIFIGNTLVWSWIFTSLYYFNESFYATNIVNQPRYLFEVSTRFWAFTVLVANGVGYGATIPQYVLVEFFSATCVQTTQFLYIIMFGAIVSTLSSRT
jgi:hypothetical protein